MIKGVVKQEPELLANIGILDKTFEDISINDCTSNMSDGDRGFKKDKDFMLWQHRQQAARQHDAASDCSALSAVSADINLIMKKGLGNSSNRSGSNSNMSGNSKNNPSLSQKPKSQQELKEEEQKMRAKKYFAVAPQVQNLIK